MFALSMILLEAGTLDTIYLILGIILALLTICTTAYALYQKIKAGDWKGAKEEMEKMLGEVSKTVDQIKNGVVESNGEAPRSIIRKALKDQGAVLDAAGLKEKMDAKLKELGLNDKS